MSRFSSTCQGFRTIGDLQDITGILASMKVGNQSPQLQALAESRHQAEHQ